MCTIKPVYFLEFYGYLCLCLPRECCAYRDQKRAGVPVVMGCLTCVLEKNSGSLVSSKARKHRAVWLARVSDLSSCTWQAEYDTALGIGAGSILQAVGLEWGVLGGIWRSASDC